MLITQSNYIETISERSYHSLLQSVKRYAQVVPAALAITLILILGMEYLIRIEPIDVPIQPTYQVPNPVLAEQPKIDTRKDIPERPEPVEDIPAQPKLTIDIETKVDVDPGNYTPAKNPIQPDLNTYSSNMPIATVLVQPSYPARALSRGLEGFVDVRFDVSPMGTTFNIVVTGAEPKNVFDKAAIKAVKNWKFQPVRIKGEAKSYAGMEQRLTFLMES